ncbi:uncharacterized protein [Lolium perenne]|uniref:uncharacterized protein n=1 Tax=Lolium perenne TaxID=4522 RepID=UPI003A9A179C
MDCELDPRTGGRSSRHSRTSTPYQKARLEVDPSIELLSSGCFFRRSLLLFLGLAGGSIRSVFPLPPWSCGGVCGWGLRRCLGLRWCVGLGGAAVAARLLRGGCFFPLLYAKVALCTSENMISLCTAGDPIIPSWFPGLGQQHSRVICPNFQRLGPLFP